jgi:F-type H+-transporting ATPase subunit a
METETGTAAQAAEEVAAHGAEVAHGAETAAHGGEAFDPAGTILHHVLDDNKIEIPFTHSAIELPHLEIAGFDISITKHVVMMWLVGILLTLVFVSAARKARREQVPRGALNFLEPIILFIRDEVARRAIGEGADRFVPYLLTTFFFILFCNLLGLVPGMATATGNISVTAALAIFAFLVIQLSGVRRYGFFGHLKNQMPHVPVALYPLFIVIEFLSNLIRPFVLCIRLFANMMGGHVVILAFISLIFILGAFVAPVSVFFALFVHFLEILVAFLQAYIFTMLTAQFISMSVHPAH